MCVYIFPLIWFGGDEIKMKEKGIICTPQRKLIDYMCTNYFQMRFTLARVSLWLDKFFFFFFYQHGLKFTSQSHNWNKYYYYFFFPINAPQKKTILLFSFFTYFYILFLHFFLYSIDWLWSGGHILFLSFISWLWLCSNFCSFGALKEYDGLWYAISK